MAIDQQPSLILRFRLPVALQLCVLAGRWQPCIHQARVDVGNEGDVEIGAFNPWSETESRRIVFDQAQRFLIAIAGGRARLPTATFHADAIAASRPTCTERYSVITGAAVSITRQAGLTEDQPTTGKSVGKPRRSPIRRSHRLCGSFHARLAMTLCIAARTRSP